MTTATILAVAVASLLVVIKAIAWIATGSVSILGSLIDSLLDTFASLVNFFAVRHSLTPPDTEHRFGHGKAEALAGLAQFAFMSGSATFLLLESARRVIWLEPLTQTSIGYVVIIISMVLTIGLVAFQKFVVRKTKSLAVSADELHYRGDILMNLAVLVALALTTYGGFLAADAIFGIGIAIYLGFAAAKILLRSFDELMDKELEDADRKIIRDIVEADPDVISVHDLRTRKAGMNSFIQLHLELEPNMSLLEAHEVSDRVELEIRKAFPSSDVIIHQDPAGLEQVSPLQRT